MEVRKMKSWTGVKSMGNRTRYPMLIGLIFIAAVLFLSCSSGGGLHRPKGNVVATVNQEKITAAQVDYAAEQLRVQVSPGNLQKILDRMVSVTLLAEEAVRRGYLKDERVVSGLAWMERMLLADELASRLAETIEPTPAEVADYFQKHREEFCFGLKMNLMVLPDSILAERTVAELKEGADFLRLARERSMDTSVINVPGYPTRGVGMSLGWSLRDEEMVFALKPGEVSPVIVTPVGYQIVRVVDKKRITETPSFNDVVQFYLSEALKAERRQEAMDSLLNSLRARAKIELKPDEYLKR